MKKTEGGYIGLISLLIATALIAFLVWRADLFGGNKDQKSAIEQDLQAIDSAKNVKNILEQNSKKTSEEI